MHFARARRHSARASGRHLPDTSLCWRRIQGAVTFHLDWAAVHSLVVGNGAQALNWTGGVPSISSHGLLVTVNLSGLSELEGDKKLVRAGTRVLNGRTCLFYTGLTRDTTQDPAAIWTHIEHVLQHLDTYYGLEVTTTLYAFSDGCPDQYKGKIPTAMIAHFGCLRGICIEWNFGQARHSKSMTDSAASKGAF